MQGIYHKVGVNAPLDMVYQALTTREGLANWWTTDVGGGFDKGEIIHFTFGPHFIDMTVRELSPAKNRVVWQCPAGPEDWIGSYVEFDLRAHEEGEMTLLFFRHRDWRAESEFTAHCSTKWAVFLLSLKDYLEKGKGQPFPRDRKIDEMN
jgi:uncharacterized protein YndB with AHSA1/START domain